MKLAAIKKQDIFFPANILSILRFFFAIALFYYVLAGQNYIALGFYAIAMITDFLDGYLARKYNRLTTIGYYLDAYADNTLIALTMLSLFISGRLTMYDFIGYLIIVTLTTSGFFTAGSDKEIFYKSFKRAKMKEVGGIVIISVIILGILNVPYYSPVVTGIAFTTLFITSSTFLISVLREKRKQKRV